jgi:hypothetical protein
MTCASSEKKRAASRAARNLISLPGGATHQGFGVTGVNETYVVGLRRI